MDGFGPIHRETDEPVFHEPWESRVFAMFITGMGLPPVTGFDAARHGMERLDPVMYLTSSYYERWLAAMESRLTETGTLSREEIEARVQRFADDPHLPIARRDDPVQAEGLVNAFRIGRPAARKIRQKPRFAVGDKIVTGNLNPHGHTRLPRYARAKRGVIVAHRGAHVFPDSNAHGQGENPLHLYTVRIAGGELWGDSAEPNENVLIDLWESYLQREKAPIKSAGPKNTQQVGERARPHSPTRKDFADLDLMTRDEFEALVEEDNKLRQKLTSKVTREPTSPSAKKIAEKASTRIEPSKCEHAPFPHRVQLLNSAGQANWSPTEQQRSSRRARSPSGEAGL
jgi:nitrile hydratase